MGSNVSKDAANPNQGDSEASEYVVDKIVRAFVKDVETKYIVRWYGYYKYDDTVNPAAHVQDHFNVRYWKLEPTRLHRLPATL